MPTGSIQRKLRWVEIGVFRWVWASHHGAGYYFVNLGGLHLVFAFFPFLVSAAQIICEFWKNR
jgi:hypothetical protein